MSVHDFLGPVCSRLTCPPSSSFLRMPDTPCIPVSLYVLYGYVGIISWWWKKLYQQPFHHDDYLEIL